MVKWVLIVITAKGLAEYNVQPLGDYATISECHVASTQEFRDQKLTNQEPVCIRVSLTQD